MSTEYVVLWSEKGGEGWIEADRVEARSAQAAIAAAVQKGDVTDADADRFVAIPSRSFRPVTVKVETKTALKFS